jgi:ABC-type antimicrobial peptide transport system permease subunit
MTATPPRPLPHRSKRGACILWMSLRDSMKVLAIGITLGVLGAWVSSRLISSMLYGLSVHDPATIVGAALLIVVVAGLAAFVPARRAARLDPMVA